MIMMVPGRNSGLSPPAALVMIRFDMPSSCRVLIGRVISLVE